MIDDYTPERTIFYDYRQDEEIEYADDEAAEDKHLEGGYSGDPDYHTEDNSNIIRETVSTSEDNTLADGTHLYRTQDEEFLPTTRHYSSDFVEAWDGSNTTTSEYCVEREPVERVYLTEPTLQSTTEEFEDSSNTAVYDEGVYAFGTITAEVTYNEQQESGDQLYTCAQEEELQDGCEIEDYEPGQCADDGEHDIFTSGEPEEVYFVRESEWEITYDTHGIVPQTVWGPVNSKPGEYNDPMFDRIPGFSHDRVKDTSYGYNTIVENDDRQGSNDPSVSANNYELRDGSDPGYTGSGFFEAHRTSSNVGNADGPDGEVNGVVAYHEEHGVKGGTVGFGNETWNGDEATYVTRASIEDEIENVGGCPGDTVRCVASIDIRTAQSGWGSEPQTSYEVELE